MDRRDDFLLGQPTDLQRRILDGQKSEPNNCAPDSLSIYDKDPVTFALDTDADARNSQECFFEQAAAGFASGPIDPPVVDL